MWVVALFPERFESGDVGDLTRFKTIIEAGQWLADDLLQQPCRSYTRYAASMMVLVSPRCHTGRNALLLAPTNRLCPAGLQYWELMLANRVLPLLFYGIHHHNCRLVRTYQ